MWRVCLRVCVCEHNLLFPDYSQCFRSSTPSDSSPNYASILPLPSPRPTTSEGDVPISWLYTDDTDGSTDPPEPTVAPSYPVLHACLVLGGDVPSCVAQAQLYGQLLYEHTVNSLQKPAPDEATPSAIEVIKQKHPYAEVINGTVPTTAAEGGEQPGTQSQKPQVIAANFPFVVVQGGGADGAETAIEKVPSKDQYVSEEFPHAVVVQGPGAGGQAAGGSRPEDYPHAQVIDTPTITNADALPILQQVLNKVQYVQETFPHAQLIDPAVSAAVNTQINNPIKDLKNPDGAKPTDTQRENEAAESVPVFPDDAAEDQPSGAVDEPPAGEESPGAAFLTYAEGIEHTQATNLVIQNIQQVIQSVRPQAQAQKPSQDADTEQTDDAKGAGGAEDAEKKPGEDAGAHRDFKKDAKAQLIERLFPHAQVIPNRPRTRGRGL